MKDRFFKAESVGVKAVTTATVNGDAVDIRDFDGLIHVIHSVHNVAKSAARKLNAKMQHSESGTGNWSTISGTAIPEVGNVDNAFNHTILRANELRRYIRVNYTRASSGSSFVATCSIIGWKDPTPPEAT